MVVGGVAGAGAGVGAGVDEDVEHRAAPGATDVTGDRVVDEFQLEEGAEYDPSGFR